MKLPRYTVLFNDGIGGGAYLPEPPGPENTASSLEKAARLFETWMHESGNDYSRGDGYAAPSGEVYLTADYDDVAYGDMPVTRFVRGVRGGIKREYF